MAYSINAKDHFNTKLYTGTGSAPNAITGVGFQPDFLWIKPRNLANSHRLHSTLLTATDYYVMSENTDAEATNDNCVTSFDTDGFTLGNTDNGWNGSYNYVSWNWKAGGAGSTNNDGSTASTVSANTNSGFSMVTHSGTGGATTIGHGLGVSPKIVISKRRNSANPWAFQQNIVGGSWTSNNYLILNTTAAVASSSALVNNVSSSTISFAGADDWVNASGSTYIHYVFAEKTGFSKFGSYTGNGNADGVFIYTGFKPGFLLIKKTSGTEAWVLVDSKRPAYNYTNKYVLANDYAVEAQGLVYELLSNGFKFNDTSQNISGTTYFYMAFAEAPLVGTNDVPCVAR